MSASGASTTPSSADLARFAGDFLSEAAEHLATIEQLLVRLHAVGPDGDAINAIFRAVHSIKGASGMFGFADMAALTHELETLLDQVRKGELALDTVVVDALLHATDVLRAQIADRTQGGDGLERTSEACERIRRASRRAASVSSVRDPAPPARVLEIVYRAHAIDDAAARELHAQLGEVGSLEVVQGASDAPVRTLRLSTDTHEAVVRTLFEFVMNPGDVQIRETAAAPAVKSSAPKVDASIAQDSIRVSVDKVDRLINQVGELVITQAMLAQRIGELDPVEHLPLLQQLADLQRNTRGLQESVMSIRMLPIASVFARFPRLVRDLTAKLAKEARVEIEGETTELDKGLIEKIVDPLVHLVRNAVDHGIEAPEDRAAQGKPRVGVIRIGARHQGGNILIEVSDDGRGLCREAILAKARERGMTVSDSASDREAWSLIFEPGFSTAEVVTDLSGRGVGLDVVKRNVASLGGSILLDSVRGAGTRVGIRLPLTLAIMDGLTVAVGDERYIVPLAGIVESRQVHASELRTVVGQGLVMDVRDEFVPVVRLSGLFGVPSSRGTRASPCDMVVLVETEGTRLALAVDDLLGQSQVVVKSLDVNYRRVTGVAGATIMGDGRVACILDLAAIARRARSESGTLH